MKLLPAVVIVAASLATSFDVFCSVTVSEALTIASEPPVAPVAVIAAVCVIVPEAAVGLAVFNWIVPALPAATVPVAPPLASRAALIRILPSSLTTVTTPPLPPVAPPPAAEPPAAVTALPSVMSAAEAEV